MAEYFFYGTGHQATFPTIHWDAAFIGIGGHYYGNIIPAILIGKWIHFYFVYKIVIELQKYSFVISGINTYGSHIIMGVLVPLLVIAPFTVCCTYPTLAKLKFHPDYDLTRGERILLEQDSAFRNAVFTVLMKYVLFHGTRVSFEFHLNENSKTHFDIFQKYLFASRC